MMKEKYKIAVCQVKPGFNKDENVEKAIIMTRDAASEEGVRLVVLPEMFYYPYEMDALARIAGDNEDILDRFSLLAREAEIYICTGTVAERTDHEVFNTSYLFGPDGDLLLKHRKCHLFDVDLPDLKVQESSLFNAGNDVEVVKTKLGTLGVIICYDIRFPELSRKLVLMGAQIIIVPGAFNTVTGPSHWHTTFRTRAIDNQCYYIAASPARNIESKYHAFGHSMILNPWGEILSEAEDRETIITAEIDLEYQKEVRQRLPLLHHRREELY